MPHKLFMEQGVLRIQFTGDLNNDGLTAVAKEMLVLEAELAVSPHRISDLTDVERVSVTYDDMSIFTRKRALHPPKNRIRSAVVATTPLQIGYARMFQTLNDHPMIEIEIFPDVASAEAWIKGA